MPSLIKLVLLVLVANKTSTALQGYDEQIENSIEYRAIESREPKQYWPNIGLVRFAQDVCNSTEGYYGTCVTRRQCENINGVQSGSCTNNGIGRCCIIYRTCGQSSAYNNTYFSSTGFPNTFSGDSSCTFTIIPYPTACQARIDFLSFTLAQPDGNGYCVNDAMVVTGSGGNIPVICGDNSGQHIYVTFVANSSITITISTSASVNLARSYSFRVTQIACDCPTLAPAGCLQYYTELTDTVQSFNYGTAINGAVVTYDNATMVAGTRQLANTNYGICVQMQPGYCSIQWAQTSDSTSFTVTGNTALAETVTGLPSGSVIDGDCTTDFVVVPNPSYVNGTSVVGTDRFCGNQFPTVTTSSKPFVLTTVTDSSELTSDDVANRGFSLTYTQLPCRNTNTLLQLTG